MPNHVTNILILNGSEEENKNIKNFLHSKGIDKNGNYYQMDINFGNVIPMPSELDIEGLSTAEFCAKTILGIPTTFNKTLEDLRNENERNLALKMVENYNKYGHFYWYSWCNENWGTKWNAYDQKGWKDNQLMFDTAWSPPEPVIEKLSRMFPTVPIKLKYCDEGGNFVGLSEYLNGLVEEISYKWTSREGQQIRYDTGNMYETDEDFRSFMSAIRRERINSITNSLEESNPE